MKIVIPETFIGVRVDVALAKILPQFSRAQITRWIKSGCALINTERFHPDAKISGETVVELRPEADFENTWVGEKMPLDVMYEDASIIVVNKPAGVVTHPGHGNRRGTLANALLGFDPALAKIERAGIVHRLDKDTSGLLVVARTAPARRSLSVQLQNHRVRREYLAVVRAQVVAGGTIDRPIGRDRRRPTRQTITARGKPAKTHYRVVARFRHHAVLRVVLETGRTHQIRVHLSASGMPIVGDKTYGGRAHLPKGASENLKTALQHFNRQALHAQKLTVSHPETKKEMSWDAPPPEDMQNLLAILKDENDD